MPRPSRSTKILAGRFPAFAPEAVLQSIERSEKPCTLQARARDGRRLCLCFDAKGRIVWAQGTGFTGRRLTDRSIEAIVALTDGKTWLFQVTDYAFPMEVERSVTLSAALLETARLRDEIARKVA